MIDHRVQVASLLFITGYNESDVPFCTFQLGFQEAHGIRGAEEPGRNVLHELPTTNTVLHKPTAKGE